MKGSDRVNEALFIPDSSDKPFAGMVREWYQQQSIVLYRLTGISSDIVDRWANLVLATLNTWDKNRPYLAVHDLSQPGISLQYAALVNFDMMNVGITIEGQTLAEELFDRHPGWRGLVAVNFNLSLSGQTNRTLMNFLNRPNPAVQYKSFYNRNKCLRWLTNGGLSDTQEVKTTGSTAADEDASQPG